MDFSLHPAQMRIFRSKARKRVAVMGRRFGKSRELIYEMITDACSFPGKVDPISTPVVLGALPTLKQAKKILWGPLVNLFTQTDLKHICADINRSDMVIHLTNGKPPIMVAGANDSDGDRLRGLRLWSLKADEYQDWKPGIRENILVPALADTPGSKEIYTGTPKGKANHLYTLFQEASGDPDWDVFNMPSSANPSKSLQIAIAKARKTMPPRAFRQEFEASFEDFPGKVFYELSEENQTHEVPLVFQTVIFGVDFGDVNPAISVLGLSQGTWYFLEGWQPQGGNPVPQPVFDQEILRLSTQWRPSGVFCDPSRPSAILGIRSLGIPKVISGYNPIEEGISQVHSLMYQRKLLFPEGIPGYSEAPKAALDGYISPTRAFELCQSYHRAFDSLGNVEEKIAEGQDDHICDSARYALAAKRGNL